MRKFLSFPSFASRASLVVVAVALTAGCNQQGQRVTMQDDFDLDLFGPHTDDLHTPYVVGAKFNIDVNAQDGRNTAGWSLKSSDPSVFDVGGPPSSPASTSGPSSAFSEPVAALAAGQATLTVLDGNGKVVDSHVVTVGVPDSVRLYAHGRLLAGASDDQARVSSAAVVSGGEATFLVRYFEVGTELSGSGALAPTATGSLTTSAAQSTLATARDWLQVDGTTAGSGQVSLVVGGQTLGSLPVTVVATSAIQSVGVAKQDDSQASDGQTLYVVGRAFDDQKNDVYGASYQWSFGGSALSANLPGQPTDVLSYQFKGSASGTVQASLGALGAATTVHAQAGSVAVTSTADVGCSVGGAPGAGLTGGAAAALGLAALAAGAIRRRRARA
jgi:MYXO-CTERM domain-containing protein